MVRGAGATGTGTEMTTGLSGTGTATSTGTITSGADDTGDETSIETTISIATGGIVVTDGEISSLLMARMVTRV